jgi:hypothetical protein
MYTLTVYISYTKVFFKCSIYIFKSTNEIKPHTAMTTDTCVCLIKVYKLVTRSVCHYTLMKTARLSKHWF